MYNWSTNISRLKKDPSAFKKWRLEQLISFGLGGEKINKKELRKYFSSLDIDQRKRDFLKFLLWPSRT